MTEKARQFAFPIAIVLMLLLTGCGSPAKRYEEATALYQSMQYAQAAKKFQQLKDFEDSASMAEKCELLATYQTPEAGKKLLSKITSYWSVKEKNPVSFVEIGLSEAEDAGDREIFAAAYPFLCDACENTFELSFFPKTLNDYLAELEALNALYQENPALMIIAEKYEGIHIGGSMPQNTEFCQWVNEEGNADVLDRLEETISEKKEVTLLTMRWNPSRIAEYQNHVDAHSPRPEPMAVLMASGAGSEDEDKNLLSERDVFERTAPELKFVDDPNCASVFLYCTLESKRYTYGSGSSFLNVRVGMETLTAVDAATGKEIAAFSDSGEKPNEVYGRGDENFAYNPDIGNWDKNEDFLAFCGEVAQYLSEQQPQSSQEE